MTKLTDHEFVELWQKHRSVAVIAKATGMDQRSLNRRRKSIENKLNITLNPQRPPAGAKPDKARVQLGTIDGTIIVFSDAHFWPGHRTTAFQGLLWAIRELKPTAVICNGDAFDGATISRYPRISWSKAPSIVEELRACAEALKEIEEAAKAAYYPVKLVWPLGNHDSRLESRLSANVSEFEGVAGFQLKDHFPNWEMCWSCWPTDDVVIKHRYRGGVHATHNNTVNSGVSIVTGHLHSLKVTPFDDYKGTRWGVDTGCLADTRGPQFVDYLEDSPTNWRSGFAVLTFKGGQLLGPEVARKSSDGLLDFRGQIIDVSEF